MARSPGVNARNWFSSLEEVIAYVPSQQVHDGYLRRYWRPLLSAPLYDFILEMREIVLEAEAAELGGLCYTPPTKAHIGARCGVEERTIHNWLDLVSKTPEEIQHIIATEKNYCKLYLRHFVRVVTNRARQRDRKTRQSRQAALVYEVRMRSPLIPLHKLILSALPPDRQRTLVAAGIHSFDALVDEYGPEIDNLQQIVDQNPYHFIMNLLEDGKPLYVVESSGGKLFRLNPEKEVSRKSFPPDVSTSSPPESGTLSTSFPQQTGKVFRKQGVPGKLFRSEDGGLEDHYDEGEDPRHREMLAVCWRYFDPQTPLGRNIETALSPRSMRGLCTTVAGVLLEAGCEPSTAWHPIHRAYIATKQQMKRAPVKRPASYFTAILRKNLGLASYSQAATRTPGVVAVPEEG